MLQTQSKFLRNNILVIIFISACFILSSCTNSSSSSKSDSNIVSGVASKGLLKNATIKAYALDADGNKGNELGTDTTDSNGAYSINMGSYTGSVIIEATGGTYTDEATNTPDTPNTETLRVAVSDVSGDIEVAVTPITEIAVRKAEDAGGLTEENIDTANSIVSSLLGGIDIITTMPADVLNTSSATATGDEKDYGLMLAAISEMVDNGTANDVGDAIQQISDDLSDNQLDDTGDDVAAAFTTFTGSENNKTGVLQGESEVETAIKYFTESAIQGSIVGSWGDGVTDSNVLSLTFYPDGTYIHWEKNNDGSGVEYGTYIYDAGTLTLSATSTVDENEDAAGLTGYAGETNASISVTVDGDTITFGNNDGSATVFYRVVDVNNPIVGSWELDQAESWVVSPGDIGSLTFYPNGTYIEWEDTDTICSSSPTGVEYGTYIYDGNSGTLTVTSVVDENGDCGGLTSVVGQTNSITGITVDGDVLSIVKVNEEEDTTDTYNRVK